MKFVSVFLIVLLSIIALVLADKPDFCKQDKDEGRCLAAFKKFYYNPVENECKEFIYGGCQGNDNRFDTKEECEKTCKT